MLHSENFVLHLRHVSDVNCIKQGVPIMERMKRYFQQTYIWKLSKKRDKQTDRQTGRSHKGHNVSLKPAFGRCLRHLPPAAQRTRCANRHTDIPTHRQTTLANLTTALNISNRSRPGNDRPTMILPHRLTNTWKFDYCAIDLTENGGLHVMTYILCITILKFYSCAIHLTENWVLHVNTCSLWILTRISH